MQSVRIVVVKIQVIAIWSWHVRSVRGHWSHTCCWLIRELAEWRSRTVSPRLRRSTARAWEARWWSMLSVAVQDSRAATLVDDAPHLLHGWHGTGPPLGASPWRSPGYEPPLAALRRTAPEWDGTRRARVSSCPMIQSCSSCLRFQGCLPSFLCLLCCVASQNVTTTNQMK